MSNFESPTVGIGRLLGEGKKYVVPHHQRDYSWSEDEIEQLFADIQEARTSGQSEYFIGLMVFMPESDLEFRILDGQQRLATTIIILSAIRTWLIGRGMNTDAEKIQGDFIAHREYGESQLEPRVHLNHNNHQTFDECVIQEKPTEEIVERLKKLRRYDPDRYLLEAIVFCRQKIGEIAGTEVERGASADKLFELVKYLRDSVKIVRLTVPSESNAYTVFETLNDRGLDLSILDLVKNYLFGKAGANLPSVQNQWTQMMANLLDVEADDFLKVWWTSRYGRVQKPQLFARFKAEISTSKTVVSTVTDMVKTSSQFAALLMADDPIWAGVKRETKECIRALKLINSKQIPPVILSALARFQPRELERLLRFLEVLLVRYQLIGGGRTGRLEISCAALAVAIYRGEVKTATAASQHIRDIFPSDQEFQDAFRSKQERNNRKVHYLLAELEQQARQAAGEAVSAHELSPSESLTVEHVLPKKPDTGWEPVIVSEDQLLEECLYRIGNMCLLGEANKKLGGKIFNEKKKVYAQSDLILTKDIAQYGVWNRNSIDDRQESLAKLAVARWRFQ